MSDKDSTEDVFLDATSQDDEITPRRSNRKRRSTAGSEVTSNKKAKSTKMPLLKSLSSSDQPAQTKGKKAGAAAQAHPSQAQPVGGDDFWVKMNAILGGTEARMTANIGQTEGRLKAESAVVRTALELKMDGVTETVESLKNRVEEQESRLVDLEGKISHLTGEQAPDKTQLSPSDMEFCDEDEVVERAWGSPKGLSLIHI